MDIQTELYLEEVTDVQPEEDAQTQTDAFLERPVTPVYVPHKSGVDQETQIEDGELFDFEFEVEPILEVLVGKTLEQGLMEVRCDKMPHRLSIMFRRRASWSQPDALIWSSSGTIAELAWIEVHQQRGADPCAVSCKTHNRSI